MLYLNGKIIDYCQNWMDHVLRMPRSGIPKQIFGIQPLEGKA
jgi:hypothetical protein